MLAVVVVAFARLLEALWPVRRKGRGQFVQVVDPVAAQTEGVANQLAPKSTAQTISDCQWVSWYFPAFVSSLMFFHLGFCKSQGRSRPSRPVIVNFYGGPKALYRLDSLGRNNYLVNRLGYALIFPEVRGSGGGGQTFVELENGFKREDNDKDINTLPGLDQDHNLDSDGERIMVTGGRHGGTCPSPSRRSPRTISGVRSMQWDDGGPSGWLS